MKVKLPAKIVRDQLVMGPVTVEFQRTLRIPETGLHPLPPGLGRFPLRRVEDYPGTAPADRRRPWAKSRPSGKGLVPNRIRSCPSTRRPS